MTPTKRYRAVTEFINRCHQPAVGNASRRQAPDTVLGLAVNRPVRFEGKDVAGFSKVAVTVHERGVVRYGNGTGSQTVMRFEICDQAHFAAAATAATAELLTAFPLAAR